MAIAVAALGVVSPALAGPPFVSDDPEPTEYKHFEIYTFNAGTVVRGDTGCVSAWNKDPVFGVIGIQSGL